MPFGAMVTRPVQGRSIHWFIKTMSAGASARRRRSPGADLGCKLVAVKARSDKKRTRTDPRHHPPGSSPSHRRPSLAGKKTNKLASIGVKICNQKSIQTNKKII